MRAGRRVIVAVGLAWPLIYDAVPEDERPWVGSTETNRQMELIFGYNTANRFQSDPNSRTGSADAPGFGWFYGRASGGQIGWLMPLAAVGAVAAWQGRPRIPLDQRQANLLLWIAWAVPQLVFFALAEFTHNYYMVMLAPAVAALSGIGVIALWDRYRAGRLARLAGSAGHRADPADPVQDHRPSPRLARPAPAGDDCAHRPGACLS